uniref:NADH-ubiquinone oxidoreductase chain 3 n=1 Tax=Nothobranchius nubaensis TaxID=2607867 RepID=A0A518QNM3_9TELE|nr:NADH dehydrogenase subunit 3 [Nothobranchius nubaensis]QDX07399.1 NADH dehydrogenase subunit 3 [Nothobranchius nubaensis]
MNTVTAALFIFSMTSVVIATLAFWLPPLKPDYDKLSPFECGFDPTGSARLPFSMRFFLVAILFILFDLEIALLIPLPWAIQLPALEITFLWTSVILVLLTLGLAYEWTQGGLEWAE